jgi:hypothetical protein
MRRPEVDNSRCARRFYRVPPLKKPRLGECSQNPKMARQTTKVAIIIKTNNQFRPYF